MAHVEVAPRPSNAAPPPSPETPGGAERSEEERSGAGRFGVGRRVKSQPHRHQRSRPPQHVSSTKSKDCGPCGSRARGMPRCRFAHATAHAACPSSRRCRSWTELSRPRLRGSRRRRDLRGSHRRQHVHVASSRLRHMPLVRRPGPSCWQLGRRPAAPRPQLLQIGAHLGPVVASLSHRLKFAWTRS